MIEPHHNVQSVQVAPKVEDSSSPAALYALPVAVVVILLVMFPELIRPLLAALLGAVALLFLLSPWIMQIDDFVESRRDRRTQ